MNRYDTVQWWLLRSWTLLRQVRLDEIHVADALLGGQALLNDTRGVDLVVRSGRVPAGIFQDNYQDQARTYQRECRTVTYLQVLPGAR